MKLIAQHAVISILVPDQDEALRFYTEQLGLEKRTDIVYAPGMRLLTVALRGQQKPEIALAHPEPSLHGEERVRELMSGIGHASPWVFATDNCRAEYERLRVRGVKFLSESALWPPGHFFRSLWQYLCPARNHTRSSYPIGSASHEQRRLSFLVCC